MFLFVINPDFIVANLAIANAKAMKQAQDQKAKDLQEDTTVKTQTTNGIIILNTVSTTCFHKSQSKYIVIRIHIF